MLAILRLLAAVSLFGGWATKTEQIDLDLLSCGNRRLMHFALNSRQSGLASAPTISQQAQTIRGRLKRKPLMRDTFESIDEATAADDVLRDAIMCGSTPALRISPSVLREVPHFGIEA